MQETIESELVVFVSGRCLAVDVSDRWQSWSKVAQLNFLWEEQRSMRGHLEVADHFQKTQKDPSTAAFAKHCLLQREPGPIFEASALGSAKGPN